MSTTKAGFRPTRMTVAQLERLCAAAGVAHVRYEVQTQEWVLKTELRDGGERSQVVTSSRLGPRLAEMARERTAAG